MCDPSSPLSHSLITLLSHLCQVDQTPQGAQWSHTDYFLHRPMNNNGHLKKAIWKCYKYLNIDCGRTIASLHECKSLRFLLKSGNWFSICTLNCLYPGHYTVHTVAVLALVAASAVTLIESLLNFYFSDSISTWLYFSLIISTVSIVGFVSVNFPLLF